MSIDQHQFINDLEPIHIPKERRRQPNSKVTAKEEHDYRSLVGQLAWPARETLPGLSYIVSDLQQRVLHGEQDLRRPLPEAAPPLAGLHLPPRVAGDFP